MEPENKAGPGTGRSVNCGAGAAACAAFLLLLPVFAGCIEKDGPPDAGVATPDGRWSSLQVVELREAGAYLVPYVANATTPVEGHWWTDGGTWKGIDSWVLLEDGGFHWLGERFGRREHASRVYENARDGVYEIDCLGEANGSFCEVYNNTVDGNVPIGPLHDEPAFHTHGRTLPAGRNYLLVQAAFDKMFRLELHTEEAIWLGQPSLAGRDLRLAPEHFRGDYINMSRCGTVAWCGSVTGGHFNLYEEDYATVLFDLRGSAANLIPYFSACIMEGEREIQCNESGEREPTRNSVGVSLEGMVNVVPGLQLSLDVWAMPKTGDQGTDFRNWWFWGSALIWFNMPASHPGPPASVDATSP